MFNIERWQEVFQAIAKNRLRTILTGVSVASGIFILIVLLGLSSAVQNGIEFGMKGHTKTLIWIKPGVTSVGYKGLNPDRVIQLRLDDYTLLKNQFKDKVEYKSPILEISETSFMYNEESSDRCSLKGCYSDVLELESSKIIMGRNLIDKDERNAEKYIVIGNKIKENLFKETDPIGEYIYINQIPFKVVGVFTNPFNWKEYMAFAPYSTISKVFAKGDELTNIAYTIKVPDNPTELVAAADQLVKDMGNVLRQKHRVAPDDESAFNIFSSVEESKKLNFALFVIDMFFWWIGIFTIIAGIVGVGNIMLIVVKERTKEIGIRKALGARPISIIGMILHESIFITTLSGFVGLIAGLLLLEIANHIEIHEFLKNPQIDFNVAMTTLVILIVTGAVAGFIPARKAARIKPIEALNDA